MCCKATRWHSLVYVNLYAQESSQQQQHLVCPFVSLPDGSFVSLSCVRSSLSQKVRSCLSRVSVRLSPRRFIRVSLVRPFVSLPDGSFVSLSCVRSSLSQTVRSCPSRVFVRVSLPEGLFVSLSCVRSSLSPEKIDGHRACVPYLSQSLNDIRIRRVQDVH